MIWRACVVYDSNAIDHGVLERRSGVAKATVSCIMDSWCGRESAGAMLRAVAETLRAMEAASAKRHGCSWPRGHTAAAAARRNGMAAVMVQSWLWVHRRERRPGLASGSESESGEQRVRPCAAARALCVASLQPARSQAPIHHRTSPPQSKKVEVGAVLNNHERLSTEAIFADLEFGIA